MGVTKERKDGNGFHQRIQHVISKGQLRMLLACPVAGVSVGSAAQAPKQRRGRLQAPVVQAGLNAADKTTSRYKLKLEEIVMKFPTVGEAPCGAASIIALQRIAQHACAPADLPDLASTYHAVLSTAYSTAQPHRWGRHRSP